MSRCRFFFRHSWSLTIKQGGTAEYMCSWCKVREVRADGIPLSAPESAAKSAELWAGARAVMALLDGVEPDYQAGRK